VSASPPSPQAQGGCATMTVPLLMLLVLIVAFGADVGWLCRY
jgi:hypothetical protein